MKSSTRAEDIRLGAVATLAWMDGVLDWYLLGVAAGLGVATGIAVVALVPLVGYLEAVAAPFLGRRLERRAGSRHAGLRVLAKE